MTTATQSSAPGVNVDRRGREIQRAGRPLVGPGKRIQAAACHQPAAPGLDPGDRRQPERQARAGRGLRRRHPVREHGRGRRAGHRHRPGREIAQDRPPARAGVRVKVDYRAVPVEELAAEQPGQYDVVTCMEMLEHVPDPASVAGLRRAGQARRMGVLLHPEPQPQVIPVRHRRRRIRSAPAAARHPQLRQLHQAQRTGRQRAPGRPGTHGHARHGVQPITQVYSLSANTSVNYLMSTRK